MIKNFLYTDRDQAGLFLANILANYKINNPVVLAIPRGGLPVAKHIAQQLGAPLDIVASKKIGSPINPEFGIGAMCEDFKPFFNSKIFSEYSVDQKNLSEIITHERNELKRRIRLYRGSRQLPDLKDKTVILVDDGIATGATAIATGEYLKSQGAQYLILAVPVGPSTLNPELKKYFNEVICAQQPMNFAGVGMWYEHFPPISDSQVLSILNPYYKKYNKLSEEGVND